MAAKAEPPHLLFAGDLAPQELSRRAREGTLLRVARGVYSTRSDLPPEDAVRANVWYAVSRTVPGALIADRSAVLGARLAGGDTVFVVSSRRTTPVELPGLRIVIRDGPGPLPDDQPWPEGLMITSTARTVVDNLAPSRSRGGRPARTLSPDEYEEWVVRLAHDYTPERLTRIRDRAREIAGRFGRVEAFGRADDLFGAVLGTRSARPRTAILAARTAGRDWDTRRTLLFDAIARRLVNARDRRPVLAPATTASLPLFEAYFSNFIEGTEFTVEEAVDIVRRHNIPANRPRDAHDILGTWQVVADPDEMRRVPRTGDQFVDLLCSRHRTVMAGRPDTRPGLFKQRHNSAGAITFVSPELVEGTLRHAMSYLEGIDIPFARAAFMLFAVSEVHPFDDGNGRVARIMMNAELHSAGEHRIVVPTVYRDEYLHGLRRLSRHGDSELLVRVLEYAWRWTSQVDWTDDDTAIRWLTATEATYDSADRDADRRRLRLPADLQSPRPEEISPESA